MIRVKNLAKTFASTDAVRDVSFSASEGEIVGILGPNGVGKTTTLRMLTTFLKPTSGTAAIAGADICEDPQKVRSQIGYLPETPALYPELRVIEQLTFVAELYGIHGKGAKLAAEASLERCSLEMVARQLCGTLSKGYRQRVGLAQALVHSPKVLILDEPISGLDPQQILQMRELIAELKKIHTILLSSHLLVEVEAVCDRVVIIQRGETVSEVALAELNHAEALDQLYFRAIGESVEEAGVR